LRILGIETSCDETSAAVVEDGGLILSNVIASQSDLHSRFGGVVPEVASRRHVELILPTIDEALAKAKCTLETIDAIGVVNRPGLIGALLVGVAAAKSIAFATGLPIVPVHHIEAHIYANWLTFGQSAPDQNTLPELPAMCLVVSGGHSDLILMHGHGSYEIVARTRDDAAGELFDKCARAMGLGYPGGPIIDSLAKSGNPAAVKFPRAKLGETLDFSFSGLKTAVIRFVQSNNDERGSEDIAASMQQAVVDVLVGNTFAAVAATGAKSVLVAGGVAANSGLQAAMRHAGSSHGVPVTIPRPILCTDNAAMVASAAFYRMAKCESAGLDLDCIASEPIGPRR